MVGKGKPPTKKEASKAGEKLQDDDSTAEERSKAATTLGKLSHKKR